MATISRTGIAGGSTISPTHITNIIDALDGTSATTTVIASGSFSGSLTGHATSATSASYATTASYVANASSFPFTGSAIISGSLIVTGSLNVTAGITGSLFGTASYATTASYALNAAGGSGFPYAGSALISGSLAVTGSTSILGNVTMTGQLDGNLEAGADTVVDLHNMGKSAGIGKFVVPLNAATSPQAGALYWDDDGGFLYIYQLSTTSWIRVALS